MSWLASTAGVHWPAPGQSAASLSAPMTRCLVFSSALGIFTGRGMPGVAPQQRAARQ
jgi:hypothetical protein